MHSNFHETYGRSEIAPPPASSTGLVFAGAAVIVAVLWRDSPRVPGIALAVAVGLAAAALFAPALLKPLSSLWFRFGLLLHRIVNPIVMFAVFTLVFVPAGMIMRIWLDPLRKRRVTGSSYWINRDKSDRSAGSGSMTNQF